MRLGCVAVSERVGCKKFLHFWQSRGYLSYILLLLMMQNYCDWTLFCKKEKKIVKKSGTNWSIAHIKKKLQSSSKNWFLYVQHTSSYISKNKNKNPNKWTKTLYYICYRQWCSISSHLLNKKNQNKAKNLQLFFSALLGIYK